MRMDRLYKYIYIYIYTGCPRSQVRKSVICVMETQAKTNICTLLMHRLFYMIKMRSLHLVRTSKHHIYTLTLLTPFCATLFLVTVLLYTNYMYVPFS